MAMKRTAGFFSALTQSPTPARVSRLRPGLGNRIRVGRRRAPPTRDTLASDDRSRAITRGRRVSSLSGTTSHAHIRRVRKRRPERRCGNMIWARERTLRGRLTYWGFGGGGGGQGERSAPADKFGRRRAMRADRRQDAKTGKLVPVSLATRTAFCGRSSARRHRDNSPTRPYTVRSRACLSQRLIIAGGGNGKGPDDPDGRRCDCARLGSAYGQLAWTSTHHPERPWEPRYRHGPRTMDQARGSHCAWGAGTVDEESAWPRCSCQCVTRERKILRRARGTDRTCFVFDRGATMRTP